MRLRRGAISLCTDDSLRFVLLLRLRSLLFVALRSVPWWLRLVCSRAVSLQMTGVAVEGNSGLGGFAWDGGVAQLEGCAVSGNAGGDYGTYDGGGRIEGMDPSLIEAC